MSKKSSKKETGKLFNIDQFAKYYPRPTSKEPTNYESQVNTTRLYKMGGYRKVDNPVIFERAA